MKFKIFLLAILAHVTTSVPVDEGFDVTTITTVDVEELTPTTSAPLPPTTKNTHQCTTSRGKAGTCTTVGDCYTLLIPENGTVPVKNRVLAEILIESSGFCDGTSPQARSDISPNVVEQILRSQVMLCCPETPQIAPDSFKLDDIDVEADVYDEMFKGRSCGHLSKGITDLPTVVSEVVECDNCTGKIVKGRKTRVGEFPWVVAMMNRNRQFCGGSLINQNTVLTAAHCVQHMTASDVRNLRLQIGDWDIYKKNDVKHEVRGVKAVKYHKGFSMQHLQHDIALLILDRPVQYTETIRAVCLHSGTPSVEDGKKRAEVAGWGALNEGGGQPSDLRAVTVRVLTRQQCISRYSNTKNRIGNGMVCAGADNGEDSCQGDSGGPLTVDNREQAKQIGVVSWGIGCGRYPGVYTAVYHYLNWINTNMIKDMGYQ